ncbi:hypothetical protein [Arsukibacterium sp.]|uniref:hypothetical protein n=1 Tax=Arsukibacterium sp. TaxID=1977258 RepID=UPI002FD8CBA2
MSKSLVLLIFCSFLVGVTAQETYVNPVDGKSYMADSWVVHEPKTQKAHQTGPVLMSGMVLLTEEHVIESNIKLSDLVAFIDKVKVAVEQTSSTNEKGELLLQFELNSSDNFNLRMSYAGELSDAFLESVFDNVKEVESVSTRSDAVLFQIKFIVSDSGV